MFQAAVSLAVNKCLSSTKACDDEKTLSEKCAPIKDLDFWKKKFNLSANQLLLIVENIKESRDDDVQAIKKAINMVHDVSSFAHEHDYKNIQANGYRSFIKLWARVFEAALTINCDSQLLEFTDALKSMDRIYGHFLDSHNNNQECDGDDSKQKKVFEELFEVMNNSKLWETFHRPPFEFVQFEDGNKVLMKLFFRMIPIMLPRITLMERIKCVLFETGAANVLSNQVKMINFSDVAYMLDCGKWGSRAVELYCSVYTKLTGWDRDTHSKNITMKIKQQYNLNLTPDVLNINECNKQILSEVTFQIIRTETAADDSKFKRNVMIYVHGGAFVGPKADTTEYLCVRKYTRAIPGLTVVNFDYTLCPERRFPTQVQELLDFYLWLTSSSSRNEVIDTFGFVPEDVVVVGESAGGQISLSLILLIDEMKKRFGDHIKLPKGILLLFAKVTLDLQVFPSFVSSIFEPVIFPQLFGLCHHAYIPMKRLNKDTGKYEMVPNDEQNNIESIKFLDEDNVIIKNYLLDPFMYKELDLIKDTRLHIVTGEFDPFLDDSVILAKRWGGKVDLRVIDGVSHSANIWEAFDKDPREAHHQLIDSIRCAFLCN